MREESRLPAARGSVSGEDEMEKTIGRWTAVGLWMSWISAVELTLIDSRMLLLLLLLLRLL